MFWLVCFPIFEPIGDHTLASMDLVVPGPSAPGVDELVRRAGAITIWLPAAVLLCTDWRRAPLPSRLRPILRTFL